MNSIYKPILFFILLFSSLIGFSNGDDYRYKIKFDMFDAVMAGTSMFYYEFRLAENIGLETGLGVTYFSSVNYSNLRKYSNGTRTDNLFAGEPISVNKANVPFDNLRFNDPFFINHRLGFCASVMPRYYIRGENTSHVFGINAVYKIYNYQSYSANGALIPYSMNKANFGLSYGLDFKLPDGFGIETFLTAGVSKVSDVRNAVYFDPNVNKDVDVKVTFNPTRAYLNFGSRIYVYF